MLRCPLGLTPFFEHRRSDTLEFINLLLRLRIGYELETMAIRIKEIDRLEDAVIDRADYVQPLGLDVFFRYEYLDTQNRIPSGFTRDRSRPRRAPK